MGNMRIVPYGRSFEEYCLMFALDDSFRQRMLGVGDGPSNFNAEAARRNLCVTSIDPIYGLPVHDIAARFEDILEEMIAAIRLAPQHWIWSSIKTPESLRDHRRKTFHDFIEHYQSSRGRYVGAALPNLPFPDKEFDVALCSHLLFSWSGVLDYEFHRLALNEMLRVAAEVKVFPLGKNLGTLRSPYLEPLADEFRGRGCRVRIEVMDGFGANASVERLVLAH